MNNWQKSKLKLEKKYGKWCTYDLGQKSGKYIISDASIKNDTVSSIAFFQKIVHCAQDLSKKPLKNSSILDLACQEGLASLVFADYGVKSVLAVDGREANTAKVKFSRDTLILKNVKILTTDLRNFNYIKKFDVVLALGILYHLNSPDLFKFVENLYKVTGNITIIDTHIAMQGKTKVTYKGNDYHGLYYKERETSANDRAIGNDYSFWLTLTSLTNILTAAGFTGLYQYKHPAGAMTRGGDDRITLIATKEPRKKFKTFSVNKKIRYDKFAESNPWILWVDEVNRFETPNDDVPTG
jgi:hypothetical protein